MRIFRKMNARKVASTLGRCAVIGGMVASAPLKAEGLSGSSQDASKVQVMVDNLDGALALGMSEGRGPGSSLAQVEEEMRKLHEICAKIEATDEQKVAIRDELFAFKEKTLPLEANLKIARLKFVQNALTASSLEADASARVSDAVNAVTAIAQAKGDLLTKILYQTLRPEQRKSALVCMAAIKLCAHEYEHERGMEEHALDL